MRYQSAIENLYDFKKEMMDVIPDILRMTIDDCHGKLERLVTDNMDKLQERHWKAVFDSKYDELFQDGISHVSWNTDRSTLLRALFSAVFDDCRRGYSKLSADAWNETWYDIRILYIKTPCGAVIKYRMEEPRSWSSHCRHKHIGSVVPPEEVPEKSTHTVVLIGCDKYGVAGIYGQFTGSMRQCEEWVTEQARHRGREMPEVKFIKLGD